MGIWLLPENSVGRSNKRFNNWSGYGQMTQKTQQSTRDWLNKTQEETLGWKVVEVLPWMTP